MSKSKSSDGQQVEILRAIWNEMKALRASFDSQLGATRQELGSRIDQTNARLEQTNGGIERLDGRFETMERRQTESEVRIASELVSVARAVDQVRDLLRERLDDRQRVDDLEGRVAALERRAG